ncbi:unnamed protein product [Eruca vesicaria subsp. sativa]|uniref:Zinc finger PHD-type domain-containing protein n=1 Tax=Eruca vesicaria subsp. sativa TaxID=29727 RepID=A0ABC8L2Y6_ERUVS|nr:unnamed protein product [Eruca vesicaria subsp. sativa]
MEDTITTFHPKHFIEEYSALHGPYPNNSYEKTCIICEKWISSRSNYFYCRVCNIFFHKECPSVLMESNLTIDRPRSHEHKLTFIRKKNCFNCDACGKVGYNEMNMYTCLPCNFFIHRRCIYLPKVIKLTRHSHRLLHTFQVPDCTTTCRLCNEPFVYGCGGYICIDKTCDYKLHSYCATGEGMWDGKDVEGEPEEINYSEDVTFSSLQEIDGKTIRHFSHHHDLVSLCINGEEEEDERVCQACILPIDFGSFLGCKECDFALHDTCANLPRKMEHPFHHHRLTLEVNMMNIKEGFFRCSKCKQESCGFMYRCCQEECEFKMDAKCASLTDPLHTGAHKHPLTLLDSTARCYQCPFHFELEPKRITLPVLLKYKCDTHPLTLCFAESIPWSYPSVRACEICEVIISIDYRDYRDVYGCTDCCTTLHAECAIGKYPYLKPGHAIKVNGFEIEIARNRLSRPICHACHSMCQDKLVFKNKRSAVSFCSINCITSS